MAAGWLFILMFCINGMNVVNSFVGRNFMSAIESRDTFIQLAWATLVPFSPLVFTMIPLEELLDRIVGAVF